MIKSYKAHAQDLYSVKVSTLPKLTRQDEESLNKLLFTINEIRPQLRKNLKELSDEFSMQNNVMPDTLKKIEALNARLISRLYLLGHKTKKKLA